MIQVMHPQFILCRLIHRSLHYGPPKLQKRCILRAPEQKLLKLESCPLFNAHYTYQRTINANLSSIGPMVHISIMVGGQIGVKLWVRSYLSYLI